MVLIDGVKYACQSCIKGHRSSKCTHTTRPLTEIKKKGRPTSQCTHCRELRKTKSVHGRCECAAREAEQKATPRLLPNGLVDAVATPERESSPLTATEPSGVTRLLNPCNCLRGGKCTCCSVVKRSPSKAFPRETPHSTTGRSPPASTSSKGGCCASRQTTAFDAFRSNSSPIDRPSAQPAPINPVADIPVSASSASTSLSPIPPAPANSTHADPSRPPPRPTLSTGSDALFLLPSTHGTHACFCGPTCACVGCAVHDPHSRKRPAPGACSGGGCKCGTDKGCEGAGKRAKTGDAHPRGGCCGTKQRDPPAPAPVAAPTKSCCGGGGGKNGGAPHDVAPLETSGIELPSLWIHTNASGASTPLSAPPEPTAAAGSATPTPLPSLRTLYPALLDLELDRALPAVGGTFDPSTTEAERTDSSTFEEAAAALLRDLELAPYDAAGSASAPQEHRHNSSSVPQRADCSAVYLQEPLDDACGTSDSLDGVVGEGDGDGCLCSSKCGCRGGSSPGEGEPDDNAAELAELAALGAFG